MPVPEINRCPSLLLEGYTSYSPLAQRDLFGSRTRRVSHILPFDPPGKNDEAIKKYNEKRKRLSISGVQEKYSLRLEKNNLDLTDSKGTHILKPVPTERLTLIEDMPANEHISMQMASQIFHIKTAACGMIFFADGAPAYITKRFDYKPDNTKYAVEDFATLLGKGPTGEDDTNFKYDASYLDVADTIRKYVPAYPVMLVELFRILLFNYLIGNGDAHLKNFSLMETLQGDFVLSPAYDLLCTRLHLDDGVLALHDGLYDGDYEESTYYDRGVYTSQSFRAFAEKAGINKILIERVIQTTLEALPVAIDMVERSFLSAAAKQQYIATMQERHRYLSLA